MTVWGYIAMAGLALACCAMMGVYGYVHGYRRGLTDGRKTEADFWIGTEKQVDQEQTRMWREEAERKRRP